MILWIILTLMTALAAAALATPLFRHSRARGERGTTVTVLKDQLRDVDVQTAEGTITEEEAQGLRGEIKRRLLAERRESDPQARAIGERSLIGLALGVVAIVALASTGLYVKMGRPDLVGGSAVSESQDAAAGGHPGADVGSMIGQLERKLQQAPNDPDGWRMLGWSYFQTGRYAEAATAYGRAVALDPTNGEYLSAQGESLVQAANGQVTPAAITAFRNAVAADPGDPRARYFLAVFKDQQGDHEGAMNDWIALLKTAPAGAPWAPEIRAFVEQAAQQRGEDISARLPPVADAAAASAAAPAPGPSADQIAAASQMSGSDQQAMINDMVNGLAARLKASPRDADGWVRLMRAQMVLGQGEAATAAYHDALKAFTDTPSEQASLRNAARELGVPGA